MSILRFLSAPALIAAAFALSSPSCAHSQPNPSLAECIELIRDAGAQ